MLRKIINPILFLPLALCINPINVLSSETKDYIDNVLEEKPSLVFVTCTVSPISNSKASKLKSATILICCLAFNNCIFANLCTVCEDVVIGKSKSPKILSELSSVSKVEFVKTG